MNYIVFVKPSCPYCVKAINLLEEKGKKYKVVNFAEGQGEVLREVKNALDWQTVPLIFFRKNNTMDFVGGYTDLLKQVSDD